MLKILYWKEFKCSYINLKLYVGVNFDYAKGLLAFYNNKRYIF